jgi:hypothetical protein
VESTSGNSGRTRPKGTLRAWLRSHAAALVIGASLATVAVVAGSISYTHICALTLVLSQSWKTAHLMPLAVDGQIIIGSAVFMVLSGPNRWWGLLGVVPGLAESLFANWESGIPHGVRAAIWATVAAQAFAVSSFLFERWLKSQVRPVVHGGPAGPLPAPAEKAGVPAEPEAEPAPGPDGPATPEAALLALIGTGSQREIADLLGWPKTRVARVKARLAQGEAIEPEAVQGGPDDPFADVPPLPRLRQFTPDPDQLNGSGDHA